MTGDGDRARRSAAEREAARRAREAERRRRREGPAAPAGPAGPLTGRPAPRRRASNGGARRGSPAGRPGGAVSTAVVRRAALPLAALAGALAVVVLLTGGGDDPAPATSSAQAKQRPAPGDRRFGTPTPTPLPPETRVVGFAGAPQAEALGILGTMSFAKVADRLERQSRPYARKTRPVLGAFDLIATIANADPGQDGRYRTRQSSEVIARHLRAARRHDAALILDVQPGTSNFVDETKALRRWLHEPDVHLALDPEWRMRPGVAPGTRIGHVSGGEIEATLNLVAGIVRDRGLPPKLVLVHRFTDGMIDGLDQVRVPEEVVGVISIDGVGSRELKTDTYRRIAPHLPDPWLPGFKVFYEEDADAGAMMSGAQVMALQPRPHVVLYE